VRTLNSLIQAGPPPRVVEFLWEPAFLPQKRGRCRCLERRGGVPLGRKSLGATVRIRRWFRSEQV